MAAVSTLSEYTTFSAESVLEKLQSSVDGLSSQVAANRLARNGKNTLLPFTAFGRDVFFFVTPTGQHIAIILLITLSYFVVTE